MCLLIHHPNNFIPERNYIFQTVFSDFLGLDYQSEIHDDSSVFIKIVEAGSVLVLSDFFFQELSIKGHVPSLLPTTPLRVASIESFDYLKHLNHKSIPILYGDPFEVTWISVTDKCIKFEIDFFGGIFFLLTQMEEYLNLERNADRQFLSSSSVLFQQNFYERPIVNEYVDILYCSLKKLGLTARKKEWHYSVMLTHDVDHPFSVYKKSFKNILRNIYGDIIYRRDFFLFLKRIIFSPCIKLGMYFLDPNYTFNFIMKVSNKNNIKSKFYFISQHTHLKYDTFYSLDSKGMRKILTDIDKDGHELGIHGNYESVDSLEKIRHQVQLLNQLFSALNIKQQVQGGRNHYLQFKNPVTWRIWSQAGLAYTSSTSFSDSVGFKAGTCYPYRLFDLEERRPLNLIEYPLIVMDVSLFGKNLRMPNKFIKKIISLSKECRFYGGVFALLWHNNILISRRQKRVYKKIISQVAGREN